MLLQAELQGERRGLCLTADRGSQVGARGRCVRGAPGVGLQSDTFELRNALWFKGVRLKSDTE